MTLLEVTVLHARDVAGAQEGGADRLCLVAGGSETTGPRSPEPALVTDVCRETDLPVRVMLRLNDGRSTSGGEFSRLVGLAQDYLARGAEGVVFGFLDDDLEIDDRTCRALAEELVGVPWTFARSFDDTLEPRRSWQRVRDLPGLDSVRTAGSPRGLEVGFDDLLATVHADRSLAPLVLAGGGLLAEHVPWLLRAGVRQFHLGRQARPGGTDKAYVDAAHVRAFRLLLDDLAARAG